MPESSKDNVDIFRFVHVRSAEKIPEKPKNRLLLRYDRQGSHPPPHNALLEIVRKSETSGDGISTNTQALLENTSKKWILLNTMRLTDELYRSKNKIIAYYQDIANLTTSSKENLNDDFPEKAFKSIFEDDIEQYALNNEFAHAHAIAWGTLYALFAIGSDESSALDDVIAIIRGIEIIRTVANEVSSAERSKMIAKLTTAIPVLPNDIYPVFSSEAKRANAPNTPLPFLGILNFASSLTPDIVATSEDTGHSHPPAPHAFVRPLGVADLRVVKHTLAGYMMGEITHIENVLKTEERERNHRYLQRTEEAFTVEKNKEKEEERDLQSTERTELQREAQKTIEENFNLEAGLTITSSGPVSVSANAGFSYSRAQAESRREASNFAKEIVDRSRKRIVEQVREERVRKTTEQIEESNRHMFVNTGPESADVSGIYRWVDKKYSCQIYNFGKRLMLEIMVPEPAAFYRFILKKSPNGEAAKGPDPLPSEFTPSSIKSLDEDIVQRLIRKYRVDGIEPAPASKIVVAATVASSESAPDWGGQILKTDQIKIDTKYRASSASISLGVNYAKRGPISLAWTIGGASGFEALTEITPSLDDGSSDGRGKLTIWEGEQAGDDHENSNGIVQFFRDEIPMNSETGDIAATITSLGAGELSVAIEIEATLADEHFQSWQLATYNKIVQKYTSLLADHNDSLMRQQIRNDSRRDAITNPPRSKNMQIINEEIKRQCISMMTGWSFEGFDAVEYRSDGEPILNMEEAAEEAPLIRFFEEAFEWERITYKFYPYFWGRKSRWHDSLAEDSEDPLFRSFLRAGAAKIILPVKPGLVEPILWYLRTGVLRLGSSLPAVEGDTEYVALVDEVGHQGDDIGGGIAEGEPWEVLLPTNLVILHSQGVALEDIR